jgi:hypothetical protein
MKYCAPVISSTKSEMHYCQTQNYLTFEVPPGTYVGTLEFTGGSCGLPLNSIPNTPFTITQDPNDPTKGTFSFFPFTFPIEITDNNGSFTGTLIVGQSPWDGDIQNGDGQPPCMAVDSEFVLTGSFSGNSVSGSAVGTLFTIVDNPADTDQTCTPPSQGFLPCTELFTVEGTM